MSLSKEQVEARRKTIGGSDVPIILGLKNPDSRYYKSPAQLYAEKNSTEPAEASEDDEASAMGHVLEPVIVGMWALKYGVRVVRWESGPTHSPDAPWATCTPDGWVRGESYEVGSGEEVRPGFGVEAKNRRFEHGWGPSGTEEIPADVEAQVRWSMLVTGAEQWGVGVLIGGNNFRHYIIKRDRAWEEWAFPIVEAFREGTFVEDAQWKPVTTSGKVREITSKEENKLYLYAQARRTKEEAEANLAHWRGEVEALIGDDLGVKAFSYEAKLSPVKGRESTDWESAFANFVSELKVDPLVRGDGVDEVAAKVIERHTHTGKPYRRLVVKEVKPKTTTTEET